MNVQRIFAAMILLLTQYSLGVFICRAQTDASPASGGTTIAGYEESILLAHPRWAVGAQLGFVSGTGIGVRYHSLSRFSLQGVFGGFKVGKTKALSLGMELQFDFDAMPYNRFYGIIGGSINSYKSDQPDEQLNDPSRFGAGAGYEYSLSEKIVLMGSLVVTYYAKSGDLFPIPQIGVFYNFR